MQAGFKSRSGHGAARRRTQAGAARSVGEFVSGNYFRTFGLQARRRGGCCTDADDVQGAPMAAVMSYETWQSDYDGDPRWWAARSG